MAHNPIFGSDPAKPASSGAERPVENGGVSGAVETAGGTDLAELAAKFAAHGGGRVSPELSADLALEIVLNEIVEQACLATRAIGAALVLERDGEWVCRASAGGNAPELGARLNAESGLSGACMKTRTVQRCDDALNDPRVDMEACRILGVRSVIVLPLLQNGELVGIFEVFSRWPLAFGERDERTLEALSQRVLRNLERASEPMSAGTEASRGASASTESFITPSTPATDAASTTTSNTTPEWNQAALDRLLLQPASEAAPGRKMNLVTLALSAAVLAYAVLLTVLVAQRLSGGRATARVRSPSAVSGRLMGAASQSSGAAGTAASSTSASGTQSAGNKGNKRSTGSAVPGSADPGSATSGAFRARDTSEPEGSLQVYENGKEVFRMDPAAHQGEAIRAVGTNPTDVTSAHGTTDGTEVQRAAAVEPAAILELPAEEAEGSLLHRVEPDYPEAARQQQIQGMVVLDLHVGQDGSVQKVTLVSGPPLLTQAATIAVKQWRFKPRLVNGRPAEVQTRITLNFRLPQ